MRSLQSLLMFMAALVALCLPSYAESASSEFKRGVQAEEQSQYDVAFQAYQKAYALRPRDPKYLAAYTRLRFYAATEHVHKGQLLRDAGKLDEALVEFQKAAEIDHTNFIAQQEMRRTADMIRKQSRHETVTARPQSPLVKMAEDIEGPVELKALSTTPINLRMNANADQIYKIIAKLAGINVLFDPDYKPQKLSIELNDVTAHEALDMLALQTKTFWQPTSSNTILVAADTQAKRKELQANVMTTFYLRNVSSSSELQEAASTLRGILDLSRVQLIPNQNAMVLRGTTDQLVLAEKLLADIDKPKPEVIIDIAVMQVSRDRIRNMGISPPTSASIVMVPNAAGSGASSGGGSGGAFTINQLGNITANNFLVSIPGASLTFLMSDSNTKLLQNPEIRALDNEKATLKIGDRVPVATGSFSPGIGGGSISPLVNTQFQYLDVGVNIDITPHIHSEDEVTLKMTLEISSVSGSQNIGGISQPVIGQRRIEHETRLRDGDVNLVGGILEDSEMQSLSGYPWITKVPILKYFFGQEDKERRENEIVFAITPHIVRAQDVTDENLRLVDVGTGNSVLLRHHEQKKVEASNLPMASSPRTSPTPTIPGRVSQPTPAPSAQNTPAPATTSRVAAPPAQPMPTPAVPQQAMPPASTPLQAAAPTPPSVPAAARAVVPAAVPPTPGPTVPPAQAPAAPISGSVVLPPATAAPVVTQATAVTKETPAASSAANARTQARAQSRNSRVAASPQASADPCPYGQHAIEWQKDRVICEFN
jgi:general secretion pathway protein D